MSAWTLWAWWIALAAAPIGFAIWGFVFNTAARDASYLGTAVGATVALGLGLVALVLGIVAIVRTGRLRDRLRGRGWAITVVVLCAVLVPLFTSYFAHELNRTRRQQRVQREWEEQQRLRRARAAHEGAPIEVTGLSPNSDPEPIRRGVRALWNQYVDFMNAGSGTPTDALKQPFYAREDAQPFLEDDPWVANERAKKGVYGLGAMGKGHLPVPPWDLEIRQIHVDRWEREATVRAWQKAPDRTYRVAFQVKRDGSRWVFALEPPEIVPRIPAEDEDK